MDSLIVNDMPSLLYFSCDHNVNLTYLQVSNLSNIDEVSTTANGDTLSTIHYDFNNLTL